MFFFMSEIFQLRSALFNLRLKINKLRGKFFARMRSLVFSGKFVSSKLNMIKGKRFPWCSLIFFRT